MNIIEEISDYAKQHSLSNDFQFAAYYHVIQQEPFSHLMKNPKLYIADSFAMINFQEKNEDNLYHGSSVSFKHGHFSDYIHYSKNYASDYHLNNLKQLTDLISNNDLTTINQELNKNPDLLFCYFVLLQEKEKNFFQLNEKHVSDYYGIENSVRSEKFLNMFRKSFIRTIEEYPLSYLELFTDNNEVPIDFHLKLKQGINSPISVFKEKYNNELLNTLIDPDTSLEVFLNKSFSLIQDELGFNIHNECQYLISISTLYEGHEKHIENITNIIKNKLSSEYDVALFITDKPFAHIEKEYINNHALKFSDDNLENECMNAIRFSSYYKDKNNGQENLSLVIKSENDIIAAANIVRNQDIYKKMPMNAIELSSFVVDKLYDQSKFFKSLIEQVVDYGNSEQKVLFISAPLNENQKNIVEEISKQQRFIQPFIIIEPNGIGDSDKAIQIEYIKAFKELLTSATTSFSLHKSKHLYQQGLDYIKNNKDTTQDFEQLAKDAILNLDESKIPQVTNYKKRKM